MHAAVMQIVQTLIQFAQSLVSANVSVTNLETLSVGAKEAVCAVQTKEEQIKKKEELIKKKEGLVKKEEELIKKKEGLVKKEEELIKKEEGLIKQQEEMIKKEKLERRKVRAAVMQIVQAQIQFAQSLASANVSVTNLVMLSAGVRERLSVVEKVVEEMSRTKRMLQGRMKHRKMIPMGMQKIWIKIMFPRRMMKPVMLMWELLMKRESQ